MTEVHFASDNNAGVHPRVLAALAAANGGHVASYGDDELTQRAEAAFRKLLGDDARVFFAFNGTGANPFRPSSVLKPRTWRSTSAARTNGSARASCCPLRSPAGS
jgi:threonine aldolase